MNNPDSSPLLATRGLCKTYPDGQVSALADVNFEVARGEYVAIMGPSGSGKSTLLNMLGALDLPDSGEVLFEGQPLSVWGSLDTFRAQKIGFVFQSFHLIPTLTVLENVQVPMFEGPLSAKERVARAHELLASVGLQSRVNHLPSQLSVGQKQRAAIARSLANNPSLLLADEPTGNLDSQTADDVLDLFAALHKDQGLSLVVITHSPEVAERAERTVRIRDGRLTSDERQPAISSANAIGT